MHRFVRLALRGILVLALILGAIALWKREEIMRLLAVNSLFSEDLIVSNFSHMNDAFLTIEVPRGDGPTSELAYGPETTLPTQVDKWVTDRDVTSLVVLKDGKIVFEEYFLGTAAEDLRISWSVAKSYLSALFGVLVSEGKIASLDDPVTKYVPLLIGGLSGLLCILGSILMGWQKILQIVLLLMSLFWNWISRSGTARLNRLRPAMTPLMAPKLVW